MSESEKKSKQEKDVEFSCSECKAFLVVEKKAIGMSAPCPVCQKRITIPELGKGSVYSESEGEEEAPPKPKPETPKSPPPKKQTNSVNCISCNKKIYLDPHNHTDYVECLHCRTSFQPPNAKWNVIKTQPTNLTRTSLPEKKTTETRASHTAKNLPKFLTNQYSPKNYPKQAPPTIPGQNFSQQDSYNPQQPNLPQNQGNFPYQQMPHLNPYQNQQANFPQQAQPNMPAKGFPAQPGFPMQPSGTAPQTPGAKMPAPRNPQNLISNNPNFNADQMGSPPPHQHLETIYKKNKLKNSLLLAVIIIAILGTSVYYGYYRQKQANELAQQIKSKINNSENSSENNKNLTNKDNNEDKAKITDSIKTPKTNNNKKHDEYQLNNNSTITKMLSDFFGTDSINDRQLHVRKLEQIHPDIWKYYQNKTIKPKKIKRYNVEKIIKKEGKIFAKLSVYFSDNQDQDVFIEYEPKDDFYFIDWESLHPYQKTGMHEYRKNQGEGTEEEIFRIVAEKSTHCPQENDTNTEDYGCLKLADTNVLLNSDDVVYATYPKDAEFSEKIAQAFKESDVIKLATKLKFSKEVDEKTIVQITDFYDTSWLVP